ncbi:MAG: type IIL restriction-modification enzyme MmeI [Acidobacteriaceae bacterium]
MRLLFCLFAEDNAIFERQQFREWIEQRIAEDGSDFGPMLAQLFQVLNTEPEKRPTNLDEQFAAFRYINGKLFEEALPLASFDRKMREMLLDCSGLDWTYFTGNLWRVVPVDHGREGLAQPGRALHQRNQHPEGIAAALPGCAASGI